MHIDSEYVNAVLAAVDAIPAGHVMTYGGVAHVVGRGGPRQVGQVMRRHGTDVPWWRVIRADGSPATCHQGSAPALLIAEGTPMLRNGRVDREAIVGFLGRGCRVHSDHGDPPTTESW